MIQLSAAGLALVLAGSMATAAERVAQSVVMNAVVSKRMPVKTEMAIQLRLTGEVSVDVTIDEQGNVEKAETVHGNPILARSAQDAVKKWKFKPIKQDDKVIKVVSTVTFDFK